MDRQHFSFWFYILQYTFIMTEISCSFITKTFFFDTLYIWNEYQILQTIVSHTRSLHKKVSFPLLNLNKSTKNNSFFTFSEEIFNEKRYFLYSVYHCFVYHCVKSVQIWCFLWSVFFSYSVQIRKNTNQKKSVFGPFLSSSFITNTAENTVWKNITLQPVWHYVIEEIMLRLLLFWYSWDIQQMQLEGPHLLIGLNWSNAENKKD